MAIWFTCSCSCTRAQDVFGGPLPKEAPLPWDSDPRPVPASDPRPVPAPDPSAPKPSSAPGPPVLDPSPLPPLISSN